MNKSLDVLFVLAFFILDRVIQTIFPVDFEMRRLFFVSNMGLMALMLVLQKRPLSQMLMIAFLTGLSIDILSYGYFLINAVSFMLTLWLVRVWSSQVNESLVELTILSILTIFIREGLIFGIYRLMGLSQLSFLNWFVYREFLTLLVHIPLALGLIALNQARLGLHSQQEFRKQRAEDPLFMTLKKR